MRKNEAFHSGCWPAAIVHKGKRGLSPITTEAYEKDEPALIEKLLEVRGRLIEADLGEGIGTEYWGEE